MAKKSSKKFTPAKAAPAARTAAASAPAAKAAAAPAAPAAAIEARAHAIWIKKGKPNPGTPTEDWAQAERELRAGK